jgi:hypothetical protein
VTDPHISPEIVEPIKNQQPQQHHRSDEPPVSDEVKDQASSLARENIHHDNNVAGTTLDSLQASFVQSVHDEASFDSSNIPPHIER